jgi:hypothetical protein
MRNLSVALVAMAWLALGQSQPPSPRPDVAGKTEQQTKTDKNAVPKTGDQSPTRSAQPLSPPETEKAKGESAKGAPSPVVVNVNVPKSELNVNDLLIAIFVID